MLLVRQAIDWITDRHRPIAEAAVRRVERVEERFGFDSGVRRVVVLSGPLEARYRPSDRWLLPATVRLPPLPPRSRMLAEFVYHEMGHAMVERYSLGSVLGHFTRRVCDDDDYEAVTARAAAAPRPRGFVSAYAACDREEDFCETLAAYLANRATWSEHLTFNGGRFSVRGDARLRRKLEAVHVLLGEGLR
jgi:hypothetical protein